MRSGTGWSLQDERIDAHISGLCDVCGGRFYKQTSHDPVLYVQYVSTVPGMPFDHMIVFCSRPCYKQWMHGKKLRYASS